MTQIILQCLAAGAGLSAFGLILAIVFDTRLRHDLIIGEPGDLKIGALITVRGSAFILLISILFLVSYFFLDKEQSTYIKRLEDELLGSTDRAAQLEAEKTAIISQARRGERELIFKIEADRPIPACDRAGSPPPEPVPIRLDQPGFEGLTNLALLAQAKASASSLIQGFPNRHQIEFLNDGWYNNCRSWLAGEMPSWIEIDLGAEFEISQVRMGSEHTAYYRDRAATDFTISVSRDVPGRPLIPVLSRVLDPSAPISDTTAFSIGNQIARYVRVDLRDSVRGAVRIDELEIFGKPVS